MYRKKQMNVVSIKTYRKIGLSWILGLKTYCEVTDTLNYGI